MTTLTYRISKLTPFQFFLQFAGWSYDPKTETKLQGRQRSAQLLANAERSASDAGCSFAWEIDQYGSPRDWNPDVEHYPVWECIMRDGAGEIVGALCGIDFGPDCSPWGDTYRRVVEAELAAEWVKS